MEAQHVGHDPGCFEASVTSSRQLPTYLRSRPGSQTLDDVAKPRGHSVSYAALLCVGIPPILLIRHGAEPRRRGKGDPGRNAGPEIKPVSAGAEG
jgi:hypothetical protein